jgi:hypothetical protein
MKHVVFVLIAIIALSSECRTTKSDVYTSEFIISNQTDTGVLLRSWQNKGSRKNIFIPKKQDYGHTEKGESPISPAQFWDSDSLELLFDDGKKLTYTWFRLSPTTNNILINDWEFSKTAERHTKATYIIAKEHRDSAK